MKLITIFFLILFLSLLESVFLPLKLVLLLIIWLAALGENLWVLSFITGIWIDLISQRNLGMSSLWFLSVIFLINLYRRKFHPEKLFFLLPFSFTAILFNNLLNGEILRWEIVIVNTLMMMPLIWLGGRL